MPVCFGISFTTTFLNQAGALVHVYTDGSVGVVDRRRRDGPGGEQQDPAGRRPHPGHRPRPPAHGEHQHAAAWPTPRPPPPRTGADLNGKAVELACLEIRGRLLRVAAAKLALADAAGLELRAESIYHDGHKTDLAWEELVAGRLHVAGSTSPPTPIYATPGIHFDRVREKGEPFAYHVFGTALVEATVDLLRGTAVVDAVRVVHDAGKSLNPLVDRGQAEGAIVQGIGWVTLEELVYSAQGRLLTDTLSTYKVPDIRTAPAVIDVRFLGDAPNPAAVLNSKAVGEPPFMYGIGAYFALLAALRAARPGRPLPYSAPLTNEKILDWLTKE